MESRTTTVVPNHEGGQNPWMDYSLNGLFYGKAELLKGWMNILPWFGIIGALLHYWIQGQGFPGASSLSLALGITSFLCYLAFMVVMILGWESVVRTRFVYFGRGAQRYAYEDAPHGVYPILWDQGVARPIVRLPMNGWPFRNWEALLFIGTDRQGLPLKMRVEIIRGDVFLVWRLKDMTLRLSPPSMMELLGDAFADPNPGMIVTLENVMYHAHRNRQDALQAAAIERAGVERDLQDAQARVRTLGVLLSHSLLVAMHLSEGYADKRWVKGSREILAYRLNALAALHGVACHFEGFGQVGDCYNRFMLAKAAYRSEPVQDAVGRLQTMHDLAKAMRNSQLFESDIEQVAGKIRRTSGDSATTAPT